MTRISYLIQVSDFDFALYYLTTVSMYVDNEHRYHE